MRQRWAPIILQIGLGEAGRTADNRRIGAFNYTFDDFVWKITTTRRLTGPIASTMFSPPTGQSTNSAGSSGRPEGLGRRCRRDLS
jgi:hypothetical protein